MPRNTSQALRTSRMALRQLLQSWVYVCPFICGMWYVRAQVCMHIHVHVCEMREPREVIPQGELSSCYTDVAHLECFSLSWNSSGRLG